MADKFFPVSLDEWKKEKGQIGYEYIKAHPEKMKTVTYEFSSIDFGLMSYSRLVYDGVVYESAGQYIVFNGSATDRVIVGKPVKLKKENPDLCKKGSYICP